MNAHEIGLFLSSEKKYINVSHIFFFISFRSSQRIMQIIDFFLFYRWISSTICLKFECESYTGDVANDDAVVVVVIAVVVANADSLVNSKLSSEIISVGLENDIKSVSLIFVVFRFRFRCILDGGGANEPLLDDVGNVVDFPLAAYDVDGELNEPGRGRVTDWLDFMLIDDKLLCAKPRRK